MNAGREFRVYEKYTSAFKSVMAEGFVANDTHYIFLDNHGVEIMRLPKSEIGGIICLSVPPKPRHD